MQSKLLKWTLFIAVVSTIAVCSIIVFSPNPGLPSRDLSAKPALPASTQIPQSLVSYEQAETAPGKVLGEQAGSGLRLKIPKISIDAAVESVGLTPDGLMDAPKGPVNAGWYNLGPRPGQVGSAVIDGHSGWYEGEPAVFDNLYKLQKGDKLYIEDEKGNIMTFVVRESRKYDPTADSSEVFVSNDGKAHLNLITCEGVWDESEKSYSSRLVVFTDKE